MTALRSATTEPGVGRTPAPAPGSAAAGSHQPLSGTTPATPHVAAPLPEVRSSAAGPLPLWRVTGRPFDPREWRMSQGEARQQFVESLFHTIVGALLALLYVALMWRWVVGW